MLKSKCEAFKIDLNSHTYDLLERFKIFFHENEFQEIVFPLEKIGIIDIKI